MVDDDKLVTRSFANSFSDAFDLIQVNSPDLAMQAMDESVQVAVVDERMPGKSGIELLCELKQKWPNIIRILITGHQGQVLVSAINRARIFHYIAKPPDPVEVRQVLTEAVGEYQLREKGQQELVRLRRGRDVLLTQKASLLKRDYGFGAMIGKSKALTEVLEKAGRVVDEDISVMIKGENGTGKDLLARAIHYEGETRTTYHSVNMGAFREESLFRSEMFGTVPGAFTGAIDRAGHFEKAHNGTLFLNEIGTLPMDLQAVLLQAVDERIFCRVGSTKAIEINVRLVTATNEDLLLKVANGQFRQDLYYRLCQFELKLPSLRDRLEDLPLLVSSFLEGISFRKGSRIALSADAMTKLQSYDFPGNVRQLNWAIERAAVLCRNSTIELDDLPDEIRFLSVAASGRSRLEQRELEAGCDEIRAVIRETKTYREAAAKLGMSEKGLYLRRIACGIE
jgi:DNA-binding NtrC family response regulator